MKYILGFVIWWWNRLDSFLHAVLISSVIIVSVIISIAIFGHIALDVIILSGLTICIVRFIQIMIRLIIWNYRLYKEEECIKDEDKIT